MLGFVLVVRKGDCSKHPVWAFGQPHRRHDVYSQVAAYSGRFSTRHALRGTSSTEQVIK